MKKLFTIKSTGLFLMDIEGAVYRMYDDSKKRYNFYDNKGNLLENYKPHPIQYCEVDFETDDHDFYREIGEGFYKYTTHEVTIDVDGEYGLFGIKHNDGRKLTDEIYYQVGEFSNGLCSVSVEDGKWGCINTNGDLVIPYKFSDEMFFNKYGIAVGDNTLIDTFGVPIADTSLNCIDSCGQDERYFIFSLLSDEQSASINKCGTASDIKLDIYDTKNRKYVVKGIPECRLYTYSFDGEPEVILTAVNLIDQYDSIDILGKGTIKCKKDGFVTIYDYYK